VLSGRDITVPLLEAWAKLGQPPVFRWDFAGTHVYMLADAVRFFVAWLADWCCLERTCMVMPPVARRALCWWAQQI
jgi:hypothetical protein